jgi:hypothetical protein
MKFGFLATAAALALSTQSASAQFIYPPSQGGNVTIGGSYTSPGGLVLGGFYSSAPRFYAQPLYAGPVIVPVRPVVPVFRPPVYSRPYYAAPYHHHHHNGRRW